MKKAGSLIANENRRALGPSGLGCLSSCSPLSTPEARGPERPPETKGENMKSEKEFLEEAREIERAVSKALSTLLREAPILVKLIDWRGADFRDVQLQDVDFSGAYMVGSVFHKANLENAQFQGADFEGAEFSIPSFSCRREIERSLGQATDEANRLFEKAAELSKELDERDDEIEGLRKARRMDRGAIERLRAEVAELKETARGRRDPELEKVANKAERLDRELAEANREIQRLTAAREQTEGALDRKDETIECLRSELADLRIENASLRMKPAAAPGSVRVEVVRNVDTENKTLAIVGRIFDSEGDHYSPGFGVKAVVLGRSGSEVLREMSENWSRAGFME